MLRLLKYIYKFYKLHTLKKYNVYVNLKSHFNHNTIFEGNNKISKGTAVSDSIIGRNTYIGQNSNLANCKIGRFCSIAANVEVVSATHPSSVFVSTSPTFFSTLKQNGQTFVKENNFNEFLKIDNYNAIIGNDVWIGTNVVLKGGITIGNGAIIAMGSVVTKDVPPYAIVGGIPSKIIKYRFTEEQIDKLQKIQWWNKSTAWLENHSKYFENIEIFLKNIEL